MAKMKSPKNWSKKEMKRSLFIDHTVGHLETILKLEIGGLPRMLICFSLVELGGRAFAAKEGNPGEYKYKDFFKLMFMKMKDLTNNELYANESTINILYDGWRNGLAHLLVPTKDFSIGDGTEQRYNHMVRRNNKVIISDKQFAWDLIKTFDSFISNHGEDSVMILIEEHSDDRFDLNYGVSNSNFNQ